MLQVTQSRGASTHSEKDDGIYALITWHRKLVREDRDGLSEYAKPPRSTPENIPKANKFHSIDTRKFIFIGLLSAARTHRNIPLIIPIL